MEHEVGNGYSIWLMPQGESASKLKAVLDRIAYKHRTMPFDPHVTLIGSLKGDEKVLLEKTRKLNKGLKPFKLDFDGLSHMSLYFKCVFVKIRESKELNEAYKKAAKEFDVKSLKFMPHLSLIYANIDEKARLEIIKNLDKGVLEKLKGFYAYKLCLYSTTGKVSEWYKVG